MDNGTIRPLSLAKKKVAVAKQVAITATMTRRERCHAKKENRREQLGFQEKESTKTLSSPKKIQSRVFFLPPSISSCRQTHWAIRPQENLATFGYRSQRKAEIFNNLVIFWRPIFLNIQKLYFHPKCCVQAISILLVENAIIYYYIILYYIILYNLGSMLFHTSFKDEMSSIF